MKEYVVASLEMHLFFGRIMKEHALFLQAAFPAGETEYRRKAECFRQKFEKLLEQAVMLSDGVVGREALSSGEVVTEFTESAECQTRRLTKIPINIQITRAEQRLQAGCGNCLNSGMMQRVYQLNQEILCALNGLITFKEKVLQEVLSCKLYTSNYPLLVEHILREAKMYRRMLISLEENGCMAHEDFQETEDFWNHIMMEHGMFIRGSLDPTECALMEKADAFVGDYCALLRNAETRDCHMMHERTEKTLELTEEFRDFKVAGTQGITGCEIRSVILPLLADHVLREANHYLRILKMKE